MRRPSTRFLALGLTVGLLLLSGVASFQTVAHAGHHEHHQAATHATAFCSWICAAGQVLDGIQLVPQARFDLLPHDLAIVFQEPSSHPIESPTSRGPPDLLS